MKSILSLLLIMSVSMGFLTGCDRSKNKSSGVNTNYDPYSNNGAFPGSYNFSGRAQVMNRDAYRAYLKGDFCRSKKWDCRAIDGDPFITLTFSQLDIPSNQQVFAQYTLNVQADRGYYMGGAAVGRSVFAVRRVNNNANFEGNVIDRHTGNGIGQRVQFLGTGNPIDGRINLRIYYAGKLILEAYLVRR